MRLALSLLLVLTACSATPADPVALLDGWREVMRKQKSVRLDVKIEVDGKHPSKQAYAGVLHFSWMGGTPPAANTYRSPSCSTSRTVLRSIPANTPSGSYSC